jgi:hypothetical protein
VYNPLSYLGINEQAPGLMERISPTDIQQMMKMIAGAGQGGDTMLAHINPQEANLLKSIGGSGTRNPQTGLPQFTVSPQSGISGEIPLINQFAAGAGGIDQTLDPFGYNSPDPTITSSQTQASYPQSIINQGYLSETPGIDANAQGGWGIFGENYQPSTVNTPVDQYGWYTPADSINGAMVNITSGNYVPAGTTITADTVGTPFTREESGWGSVGDAFRKGTSAVGNAVEYGMEEGMGSDLMKGIASQTPLLTKAVLSYAGGAPMVGAITAMETGAQGGEWSDVAKNSALAYGTAVGSQYLGQGAKGISKGFSSGAAEGGDIGGGLTEGYDFYNPPAEDYSWPEGVDAINAPLPSDEFNSPNGGNVTTWPTEGTGIPPIPEAAENVKSVASEKGGFSTDTLLRALMLSGMGGGGETATSGGESLIGRTDVAGGNTPGGSVGYNPDMQSMWDRIASSGGGQNLNKQMLASILGQYPGASSGGQTLQDLLYGSRAGTFA